MNNHRHLSSQEILDRVSERGPVPGVAGCDSCEAEMASLSQFCEGLRRADAEFVATEKWDDLLLRRRIREALSREKPHARSIFDRFIVLRPVYISALAAMIAVAVWAPFSGGPNRPNNVASMTPAVERLLPAWNPLPEESLDQGLAVLTEWEPTEDELLIARCRSSCMAGLTAHEEEILFSAVALNSSLPPLPVTGASPL